MPGVLLVVVPAPTKIRLVTATPAACARSRPGLELLLMVARPVPWVPKTTGALAVPASDDDAYNPPLNDLPPSNSTVSPGLSFWVLTRLIVCQALAAPRPEALSLPCELT